MKKLLAPALIALLCLIAFSVRVVTDARTYLREGDAEKDAEAQVLKWGHAARMYAPGNPYSRAALDRLQDTAQRAEARGDQEGALRAYREVRSAILAARSFYTPYKEVLPRANARIAALMAALEAKDPVLGQLPLTERVAWHERKLERDDLPSPGYSALAILGAALLIGGALMGIRRGVGPDGGLAGKVLLRWAALALLGLLLMLFGLARA